MTSKEAHFLARNRNDSSNLIPPAEMFSRVLPTRFIIDADLPFVERVARAWQYVKSTRFLEEEHERLREVLAARIEGERQGDTVTG